MKKTVKKKALKTIKNQQGQGMLEYVMLLAVVAAIVLVFKGKITQTIGSLTDSVGQKAQQTIDSN